MTLSRPCHQALDSEHSWVGTQKACLEGRTPETLGLTYYHCAWTAGAPAEAVGRPGGPDGRRRAIGHLRPSPVLAGKGLSALVSDTWLVPRVVGSKASQKVEIPACRPIATLAAADGQQATAIGCA